MGDMEKVRVLVVGDSGVGKTSLTWLLRFVRQCYLSSERCHIHVFIIIIICTMQKTPDIIAFTFSHDTALPNPSWTVGCSIEVKS